MRKMSAGTRARDGQGHHRLIGPLGVALAFRAFGLRLAGAGKLLLAGLVIVGVSGVATVAATTPAFAAGAPTVAAGYGAFSNSPVVNLTGCTGTTSSATLTCTNNPISAGVTVGMGAYGVDIDSTTPNSVTSVTATTVVLSGDPSATVTATATETFTGTQAIGGANDATLSTTVTDTGNFADYGVVAGLEVYGAGIATATTVVSVSSTNMVLSQAPTAALSGATLFFNAPDVNNVLTQVTGGASNVNTSSLTVVSQPPATDGYITTSTTSTTGIVNMYQALNPVDSTFSATLAYCAPGFTYPSAGNCTTFVETYGIAQSQEMGEQIVEIIETENIYEGDSQAHFGPTTAAQGHTVTLTEAPTGGAVPTTSSGATVNYIDGDTYIMPIPAGLTYVPGSVGLIGGDAVTSASGATTAKYCTATGTGCSAQMTGNYKTTFPYIEEQLGSATADEAKGGQLHTLPAITASFVASGPAGSVQNQYDTEYLVDTNVTDIININVAFDGYPTAGQVAEPTLPPYVAPNPVASLTILPSVTGTSTTNGNDDGADTGGQTVQISGSGFTSAGGEQVFFGANPASSFTVNSNTSITAVAPASTTGDGPVDVTVSNGGQTSPISQPADQFTYIPAGAPDFPVNVVPTADVGQAEVSWTPAFNEGSPTQSYLVTATDVSSPSNDPNNGGAGLETCPYTVVGTDGPTDTCTVPGLTNGDKYTFSVTATNALGTSVPSPATAAIYIGAPGAPTGVSATAAQNANSTISWTDPANTGAGPLLSETATAADVSNPSSPTNGLQCTYYEPASPSYNGSALPDQCNIGGLNNGDSYTFTVTSTNGSGTGVSSAPSSAVVPSTVPGAPTGVSATSNANAQSVVTFTAPASNGGAAVSAYTVSAADTTNPSNPVVTQGGSGSPITVTGLTNGDTYSITVTASNASGTGPASSPPATATPATVPGSPTNVTAAVGPPVASGAAAVSWTAPASNGGAGISKYTVTSSTGSKTCTSTSTLPATPATTCTVTGLTNGTNYTFTVTATNANGTSAASVAGPVGGVVPSAIPSTPTAPTVTTAGLNGQASVTWTAPNNQGSALTQYTLTPTPACGSCTGLIVTGAPPTASTTVSGLTNGTSYTFTLIATNGDGNSAASPASTAAVAGIPTAPTAVTALPTSTSGQDSVSWTASTSASGNVTSYVLTPSPACSACTGLTVSGNPAANSTTVGGLTNGTSYTFTVKATNGSGTSAASAASTGVVTGSPTAPTNVVAVGGIPAPSGDLNITWSAPSSSGLGTIDSYTATAKPSSGSSKTCTSTSTAPNTPTLACQVTGATNGTSYTVTVTATNSTGSSYTSVASAASAAAFPSTTFGAPTIGTATGGYQKATVTWTAPTALAGTQPALTGYVVTPFIGSTAQSAQTFNSTATTETVTGLTGGSAYTFTVAAINANGTGTASAKSNSVTVTGTPNAPTNVVATPGNNTATVIWTDGSSNGSNTTSYTVTATDTSSSPGDPNDGGETCTYTVASPEVDSCTFTSPNLLTNGDSYTFTVTGTNANGPGAASASSNSVTPSAPPSAPTNVAATAGNKTATVTWTDGASNGSTTTSYTVTATDTSSSPGDPNDGGETCTYAVVSPEVDSCTFSGSNKLTNGDSYTFTVSGTNGDGTGAASAPSNSVTPSTVPDAPTNVVAAPGDDTATVTWTDGSSEGYPTTSYTVTATDTSSSPGDPNDGGEICTYTVASPEVDSCTFSGANLLTNGDSYTFTVSGTNADGPGASSAPSNSVTPSTVPDAPTNVVATPGDNTATVTWTDGSSEGYPTTSYTVTATDTSSSPGDPNDGGETCTYTVVSPEVDSCTFSGSNLLTNGDSYTFTVSGTNADGPGAASAPSNSVIPSTVPDAPTNVVASGDDRSATVTWTDGSSEGYPTTSYTVTATDTSPSPGDPNDGGETCTYTVVSPEVDSCTFTSPNLLTNGDSYTFTVTGTNADGTGAASAPSNSVTPSKAPSAPTNVVATAGNQSATVTWTDGSDNGSATTSYTVTATDTSPSPGDPNDGGETCTYTVVSPEVDSCSFSGLNGLTNGDSYTFAVTGTNGNGVSSPSAPSNSVTPSTVPDAPTNVVASADDQSATVTWTPGFNEGSTTSSYTVTATDTSSSPGDPNDGGETCTYTVASPEVDSCTFTSPNLLTNGDSYTFTVTGTNGDGTGAASAPSNSVTPSTVPSAPTNVAATPGNKKATVTWTDGSDNGSSTTSYTVTATDTSPSPGDPNDGGETCTYTVVSPEVDSCTFSGSNKLTNGDSYTFTVTGTNNDGTGAASAPSNSVTPSTVPDAPTNVVATAGDTTATVTWTPGFNEGSTTSSYTVTATDTSSSPGDPNDGGETCTYTVASPEVDSCTFTSPNLLTNGDSYTFTVTGTNGDGTGAASAPSNSVTPSTVPSAPTNVAATPGNKKATVTWTDGSDNGSSTTSYTVTATDTSPSPGDPNDGGETCTYTVVSPEVDSCTFSGSNKLTNGDSYTFTVTGTNNDGTGAASAPSNSVTPSTVPDAPTHVVATAGVQTATVTWTPGSDEGSTTISYTVTAKDTSSSPGDPNDGGETCTYTVASPEVDSCTFTSPNLLTSGDSYTFTVTGTNADGTGAASAPSNSVTPPVSGLSVTVSASPDTYTNAGTLITYTFGVTNTGSTALHGVGVTDTVAGTATCPQGTLALGASENCSGSYTTTQADVVNGSITDTATAHALNPSGSAVNSAPASTTVSATEPNGLHITTTSLTPAEKGVAYKVKLTAAGGVGSYTWSIKSGALPAGLTLNTNGKITGTPTKQGSFPITFKVVDSASPKDKATAMLTLVVDP